MKHRTGKHSGTLPPSVLHHSIKSPFFTPAITKTCQRIFTEIRRFFPQTNGEIYRSVASDSSEIKHADHAAGRLTASFSTIPQASPGLGITVTKTVINIGGFRITWSSSGINITYRVATRRASYPYALGVYIQANAVASPLLPLEIKGKHLLVAPCLRSWTHH